MHTIYIIKNTINSKVYVGQTKNSLKKRWRDNYKDCSYFNRALEKYGKENFYYEVLCTCEDEEVANQLEIDFIQKYKSNNRQYGYNILPGGKKGGRVPKIDYQKAIELYQQGLPIKQIGQEMKMHPGEIYRILEITNTPLRPKQIAYKHMSDANKIASELEQEIVSKYLGGMSQKEIRMLTGVSKQTMWRVLKRNNIKSRGREIFATTYNRKS